MSITTPLMNLVQPTINVDSGLTWEQAANANTSVIDQHNHTSGSGTQIPPAGIIINTALPFNGNPATSMQAVVFQPQASLSTLTATYVIGGDLYYNDDASNVIRITSGGTVNATSSGISSGTASASFVANVLVVNSAPNTPANIQGGSLLLGNNVSGSNFLTLAPPAAMAANFSLTLPSVPGSQSFVTIDTSGNFGTPYSINQGLLRTNLAPVGQQVSPSCGDFFTTNTTGTLVTNLSVTITTTGRPIMVFCEGDGVDNLATPFGNSFYATVHFGYAYLSRNAVIVMRAPIIAGTIMPPSSLWLLDTQSAGTYTYTVSGYVVSNSGGGEFGASFIRLVAYEL